MQGEMQTLMHHYTENEQSNFMCQVDVEYSKCTAILIDSKPKISIMQ